jgi:hypothetical protein
VSDAFTLNQPKRTIVLDLETKRAFDGNDRSRLESLGVSVVGLYRYDTDRLETYDESEFSRLSTSSQTELIVGFNINRFDLPVLQPHVKVPLRKVRDRSAGGDSTRARPPCFAQFRFARDARA